MPNNGLEPVPGLDTGLEDRLRGLIFTNQTPQSQSLRFPMETIDSGGNPARPSNHFMHQDRNALFEQSQQSTLDSLRGTAQPPKSSKRRPNQAQRRQINHETAISMASNWTPHHTLQQANTQHNRSVSHPFGSWEGMHPTGAFGERRLPGYWPELNAQTTSWRNNTASPLPTPAESHTNIPHYSNWHSRHSMARSPARGFPAPSTYQDRRQFINQGDAVHEAALLDGLCYEVVRDSEIDRLEIVQKENFRQKVEVICQRVIADYEFQNNNTPGFPISSVELKCFGSMASGFATKFSDMDLGLFSPFSKIPPDSAGSPIPRLIEKAFLEAGYGARLLSRTRVPIIKLCEAPSEDLRCALLAERAKWESGVDLDMAEGLDDRSKDPSNQHGVGNDVDRSDVAVEPSACPKSQLTIDQDHGGVDRTELKQNANSSLTAYYGLAKRVLRRAGGRDLTVSNHRDFTSSDWVILNHVCREFVRGLYDNLLRQRLESRLSFSSQSSATGSFNRSLAGIFTQVEGERLLLDWEHFLATDAPRSSTGRINQIIRSWVEVQNKLQGGDDPLAYHKELQSVLERLRSQPEIQLMQLAQGSKETPSEYHSRACNLVRKLGGPELGESNPTGQRFVLAYISGIQDEAIRNVMAQSNGNITFDELGLKHKCLQLARELEGAVGHELYAEDVAGDIVEYVRLLRMPVAGVKTCQKKTTFRIPVTKELAPILSRIRLLTDPRKLAMNQAQNKFKDPLEFPHSGVGVQCDINFSAHLALQNTRLLRCYSLTDPRVRPMVLFIKKWAKVRGINSGYRGTLSSYGFVLMVLHFLVNVSKPFVCPNLQHLTSSASEIGAHSTYHQSDATLRGYNVQFWQNEPEISRLAADRQLTYNTESIGHLIRGFFEYFAQSGSMSNGMGKGFDWGRDVLSLRTHGGLLTKEEKGWTGAKTVIEGHNATQGRDPTQNGKSTRMKEVRHRYLFAIEDPFELDHNVARTVTHNGIVAIRDEFRRAWRLIRTSSRGWSEDLLSDVTKAGDDPDSFEKLLEEIHGPKELWQQF